ncbi:hypothetical protein ACJJTC_007727 [Scirpophaga incertulas]
MDYNYEQTSEVEALDSIYYGDMQIIDTKPYHRFSIPIKSEGFDEGDGLSCQLIFTYTQKYPDELPVIEIDNEENFENTVDKKELLRYLVDQVSALTKEVAAENPAMGSGTRTSGSLKSNTCTLGTKEEVVTSSSQEFKTCTTPNSSGGDGELEVDDFGDTIVRAARRLSYHFARSLPTGRPCEHRLKCSAIGAFQI